MERVYKIMLKGDDVVYHAHILNNNLVKIRRNCKGKPEHVRTSERKWKRVQNILIQKQVIK